MREHPDEALMIAGSLQARNPGDPDALICQATALMLLRKPEEALRAADAVLAADSTHREAGVLAATILDDMGRPADGVTRLRAVVASHPGDRGVLFAYGATLERADQVDSSLAVFDRLIRAYPDDDEILNHAGYICIDRGVRVPEGLAWVQRALDRQPDNGAYLDSYGWGLFRTGRLGDSLGWLRRAAEKSPREAEIRLHLGAVLEALGRPGEAGAAYDEALRLRPGDPGIQRRRAGVGAGGGAQPPAEQPTPKSPASK
jgi:Flp pilus assembly protein TadD